MSLQIAEEIAASAGADLPAPQTVTALMEADPQQFGRAWKWIGAAHLAYDATVSVFAGSHRDSDSSASIIGNALAYLSASGLLASLPNSAVGRAIETLTQWVETDAFIIPGFDGAVVLSGGDVSVTAEGNLAVRGLGDTGVGIGHEDKVEAVAISIARDDEGEPDLFHLVLTIRLAQNAPIRLRAVR